MWIIVVSSIITGKTVELVTSLYVKVYVVPGGFACPDWGIGSIKKASESPMHKPTELLVPNDTYGLDPE